jgi:hypothetical protein
MKMKMNRGIKWMATLVAAMSVMALATTAEARPGPRFRHGPPPMSHHHHHHGGSFVGAMVGTALAVGVIGALASAAEPEPVVVQQPVVYQPVPVVEQQVVCQPAPASGEQQQQQQVVYQTVPVVVQQPVVVQTRPVVRYRYSTWW